MNDDEKYMTLAIELAREAALLGDVPVGAVIVQDGKIIAACKNEREKEKNALAHAELSAISAACKALGGWRLPRCTLYVTLEPCVMCAGAIINSRIDRVVFAAYDRRFGAMGSMTDINALPLNHKCRVEGGLLEEESAALLQQFFKSRR